MRGDGKTTRQIQASRRGATFIWCSANCGFVRDMAEALGRKDLHILPYSALERPNSYGLFALPAGSEIVIDHACKLNEQAFDTIARLRSYRRIVTTGVPRPTVHTIHAVNCAITEKVSDRCSCRGFEH